MVGDVFDFDLLEGSFSKENHKIVGPGFEWRKV